MASSELKTKKTRRSVEKFLAQIVDAQQRADCRRIAQVMRQVTGKEPAMWGSGMVVSAPIITSTPPVAKGIGS